MKRRTTLALFSTGQSQRYYHFRLSTQHTPIVVSGHYELTNVWHNEPAYVIKESRPPRIYIECTYYR